MIEVNGAYISADISDIIGELKNQLAINGIQLFYKSIDTSNNVQICCPFHKQGQERKPSMGILKSDGTCHCFACGWVGSIHELISNCFGYDDLGNFGGKWLVKNFLTLEVNSRNDIELGYIRHNRSVVNRSTDISSICYIEEVELDKYRYTHPYWKKRGITDENIIELFDLGYDKETDCITFPIRDKEGNCLFIARRSVRTKYFNYPTGAEKPLYGLFELYQLKEFPKEVIVCESMLDALAFWEVGKYAVALNGTGTSLQFKQLRELPCRKLILATDMDEAGIKARHKLKMHLKNKIVTEYIFPDGIKDANECLCKCGKETLSSLKELFI